MKRGTGRSSRARVAVAAFAACVALGASGCSLMTPSLSEVEESKATPQVSAPVIHEDGVLTVGLSSGDAPLAMLDTEGVLTGYSVDLSAALADELGLDVKFVDAASAQMADEKGADIYLSIPSAESTEDIDVVGTTMTNATAVFAKSEGDVDITALPGELDSARVAVQDQSASQDILTRSGSSAEQVTFSNVNECFEALDAGEADYVVCEACAGSYLARSYQDVVLAGTLDEAENYGVAISSDNLDLQDAVKSALDDLMADGTLAAVYARWFGENPFDVSTVQIPGITIADDVSESEPSEDEEGAESTDGTDGDSAAETDGTGTSSSSADAEAL